MSSRFCGLAIVVVIEPDTERSTRGTVMTVVTETRAIRVIHVCPVRPFDTRSKTPVRRGALSTYFEIGM